MAKTYIWRMLVCVNLLGPHCNEEKEPKEVEQEHLKQEKKNIYEQTILLNMFGYPP